MWVETSMVCSLRQHLLPAFGLLLTIECILSLKLLELRVPAHVPLGTRAQLWCRWQLGAHDVLYSVKWYKDGKEFFRYVPRDQEPRRKFSLSGVDVEEYDSTGGNLTLAPAVLETGGRYRCEVSGERPLFPTVTEHADLMVVVLPEHGPIISGLHPRYRPGDRLQATCTSGPSRPATRLSWYINGEPAPARAVLSPLADAHGEPAPARAVLPPLVDQHGELTKTSLMLDFIVKETDFKKNGLKIKCLATLAALYWRSNEESALKEKAIHDELLQASPNDGTSVRDMRVTRADRVLASSGEKQTISVSNYIGTLFTLVYGFNSL